MKNYFKIALAWMLTLTLVLLPLHSAWIAVAETTYPIIENPPPIVVYINEGTVSSMSAEALKTALEALEAEIRAGLPDEYKSVEIIFTISDVKLDASNLEDWYIYDHTDTGFAGSNSAYTEADRPVSTDKHIYYSHSQVNNLNGAVTGTSNIKMEAVKVSDWVMNPPKYYSGSITTLGVFDQHINVNNAGNSTSINFAGYYNSAYFDFMLYPCEVEGKKLVTFGIDSSAVNGHTLGSAGFLINAGIDSNGYLQGYYLCYHYNDNSNGGKSTPSSVRLYKFNGNKTAEQFHEYLKNNTTTASADYSVFFGSAIADIALTQNNNFWTQMSVTLEILPTSLTVSQKATSSPNAATKVIDITTEQNTINDTGYNGFGPVVGYVTHGCARATLFTYSNIKMYTIHPDSLYDILEYGSYPEDASIYFVDLADDDSTRTNYPTYEDAIEYIEEDGIYYLPNYPTPKDIKNGKELTGNNVTDLADEIAQYIISTYQKPSNYDDSNPTANLTLTNKKYDENDDNGGLYPIAVKYVRRDLIPDEDVANGISGTVDIYSFDILSAPSDSQSIIKYSYTITDPDGNPVTPEGGADHLTANGLLMQITNDRSTWPAGVYTITLNVTDDSNPEKISENVTKTFVILEDVTPPEIRSVTVDYDEWKLTFSAGDPGRNDVGPDKGETTAYGIYNYEVVLSPNNLGDTFAGYMYNDATGTWIYADYVTAGQHVDSLINDITLTDIPLPKGEYTLVLRVYDEAGNFTEVNLPAIDFIKEELKGIGGVADVDGITVTNGNCGIDENWIGSSVDYTTSSNTDVTVVLPDRPSAPAGVNAEATGDGGMKLTGVDTDMEYKGKNDAGYTSVTNVDEDSNIIVPVDEYEIRYKAEAGKSFASPYQSGVKILTYKVTVKDNLDGNEWNDADAPTITLQYIIDNDTDGVVLTDLSQIPNGEYKILANGTDTGKTVAVNNSDPEAITIQYYTLTLGGDQGVDEVRVNGSNVIELSGANKWAALSGSEVTFSAKLNDGYSWLYWTPDSETYDMQNKTIEMTVPFDLTANSIYTAVAVIVNRDDDEADGSTDWTNWTTGNAPVITYVRVDDDENNPDYKDENYRVDEKDGAELANLENRTGIFRVYVDGYPIALYVEVTNGVPNNSVALNFYTLTLETGTGITLVDNDGNSSATKIPKVYLEGSQVNISADVASGYYWSKWIGDDGTTNANQNDTVTIAKNLTLTSTAVKNTVAVNITKDGIPWSGTVTLKPSGGGTDIIFASGSPAENIPDGTYEIYVNGADTSKTIIVSGGFVTETLNYYTVTLISGNGIAGTSGGGIYLEGSKVNISASLQTGYAWSGWTGSFNAGERNAAITISGNVTLTANASYVPSTYDPTPSPGTGTVVMEEQEQPENQPSTQPSNVPSGQNPIENNSAGYEPVIPQYPVANESESGIVILPDNGTNVEENDANQTDYGQTDQQNSQEDPDNIEPFGENILPSGQHTDQPQDTDSNTGNIDSEYESDKTNNSGDTVIIESEERRNLIAADAFTLPDGRLAKDLGDGLYEIYDEDGIPLGYIQLKPGEEIDKVDINARIFTTAIANFAPEPESEIMEDEKAEESNLPVTGGFSGTAVLLLGLIMTIAGIVLQIEPLSGKADRFNGRLQPTKDEE